MAIDLTRPLTEQELNTPLTEPEQQRLADYEHRVRAWQAATFAAEVCGWPPEADEVITRRSRTFSDFEPAIMRRLEQRRDYPVFLRNYRTGLEAQILGPATILGPREANLAALKEQFDREHHQRTTPTSRHEHAREFLARLNKTELRARFDRYDERTGEVGAILDDVLTQLVEQLAAHVRSCCPLNGSGPPSPPSLDETPAPLTLRQVALLCIYTGRLVQKSTAAEIAREYKHSGGPKLYDHYRKLAGKPHNRTGVEGRAIAPMMQDIATVAAHLTRPARQQAESERSTLAAKERP